MNQPDAMAILENWDKIQEMRAEMILDDWPDREEREFENRIMRGE